MACRDVLARTSIRDIMHPCSFFVSSRDLVTRARALMRESGFRTLPVIDGGRLVGVITSQDIMRVTSTRSNIPVAGLMHPPQLMLTPADDLLKLSREMLSHELSDLPVVQSHADRTVVGLVRSDDILRKIAVVVKTNLTVGEIMTRKVVTCEADEEISAVWEKMEKTRCSGLPVVCYNRQKHRSEVIGMITRSDIIRSGMARLERESDKGRFRAPPRVRSLMRTPAITAMPEMTVPEAIELMLKRNVGRLPVLARDELVGILSRSDIIKVACGG
jgi:CBS domain-containing protein